MTTTFQAPKSRWGRALFHFDARRRLERAFSRCLVAGLPSLAALLESGPAIVAMNHVSFWDGFLLPCLERALGADAYCLMDGANLAELSFLRFAGALPLDRTNVHRARADLECAARVLDRSGRLLFVFPSGEQAPARFPLRFLSGVSCLAQLARVPVVPVGLAYEFLGDAKPEIRLSIGPAISLVRHSLANRRHLEQAVRAELDWIDASLVPGGAAAARAFTPLFRERPQGIPTGARLLGRLTRGRST
jgi:1-acyl-sn-glycerol-3-phosphate acyltransferase